MPTQAELDTARTLLLSGKTLEETGAVFKVSKEAIRQWVVRYKLIPEGVPYGKHKAVVEAKQKSESAFVAKYHRRPGEKKPKSWRAKHDTFQQKKHNCARLRVPFELDFFDLEFPDKCPVLGINLDYEATKISPNSPSFDRKNPAIGYIAGNVQIMSVRANALKNNLVNTKELKLILRYMLNPKSGKAAADVTERKRKAIFRNKRSRAAMQGIKFTISEDDLFFPKKCPVLGVELDYGGKPNQDNLPSIDRVNPRRGYVPGNVIVISYRANRLKLDATPKEIERLIAFMDNR